MKKYALWARRSPLRHFCLILLIVGLVNLLFWVLFDWNFTWKSLLGDIVCMTILEVGIRGWERYEKESGVTTTLYKDRKKAEAAQ